MDTGNISVIQPNWLKPSPATPSAGEAVSPGAEVPASGGTAAEAYRQGVAASANADNPSSANGHSPAAKQQIVDAVKNVNDFLQNVQRTLQFIVDPGTGHMVVQVKDAQTNQVISQIPSETMLKIAKELDSIKGLLFNGKA